MRACAAALVLLALALLSTPARAATITMGPGDDWTKLEAAQAGDTVLVAPGTYSFLVRLTGTGTADAPIIIKAQDPANRPTWDLTGTYTETAPGSYGADDRDRGCWQIVEPAAYYVIDGIEFTNCRSDPGVSGNAGGIRLLRSDHVTIRNCLFQDDDNGLIGGGDDVLVEFSEFNHNGQLPASADDQEHNIYVLGGSRFVLRYSYVHDSTYGQNLHLRSHDATIEYNWIARAGDYEMDLVTYGESYDKTPQPPSQSLLLRGNVIINRPDAENTNKIVALYDDNAASTGQLSLSLIAVWNTFVVQSTGTSLVQAGSDSFVPLAALSANLSNNVVVGAAHAFQLAASQQPSATLSGVGNLFPSGADIGPLTATVFGDPGFTNASALDFTLTPGSAARQAADPSAPSPPAREYFRNEIERTMYRCRPSVADIGAFESTTTGAGIGPYDDAGASGCAEPPPGDAGTGGAGAGSGAGGSEPSAPSSESESGCGCRCAGSASAGGPAGIALCAAGLLMRRRRGVSASLARWRGFEPSFASRRSTRAPTSAGSC